MKTLSERIKSLRLPGETQALFAERLGTTQASVSRYINGREPDRKTLLKISKATGASLDWLITGREGDDEGPKKSDSYLLQMALGNLAEISAIPGREREKVQALISELALNKETRKEVLAHWEGQAKKGRK